MEWISEILSLISPENLGAFLAEWGWLAYPILIAIIFSETGLLVGFFLPGDSLLFVAGFIASTGSLNMFILNFVLMIAAIAGDTVGYMLGRKAGHLFVFRDDAFVLNRKYLEQTQAFYVRHGGKTIVLARFIPIIRTFAPFVAGLAKMNYRTFVSYNVFGGIFWILSMTCAGYYLGNIPWIKQNFEKAVIGIIILSIMPPAFEYLMHKFRRKKPKLP